MTNLRVIDGSKRAKAMAEAHRRVCPEPDCGGNAYRFDYVGEAVDSKGRVVMRPKRVKICSNCDRKGKRVEMR